MTIRVLICDELPVVRDGLAGTLARDPDITVVAATGDGAEALDLTRHHAPHVLITDIGLARRSGLEVAAEVTGPAWPAPRPEVLVFSARTDDAIVMKALEAGAYGYLVKDAPSEELIRAVRALAAGEAATSGPVTRRLIGWLYWRNAQPVAAAQQGLRTLTPREREILLLVAAGLTDADIAAKLTLQEATVRSHVYHLREKLGLRDRAQLVAFAYQSGFTVPTVPDAWSPPGRAPDRSERPR
ncbi:response regulator transcription factor [Streptomyces ferrugineus]|uniref:Response regulator transcription factor n=1 Tax=Streptomyces ferrugineus TaxID=1413221 RepID=A0A7M2SBE4_9ACTN|nr:response regulator transcription factor [Streptomyces ferrugineus]QOV33329.1 response regulator transcription factor [Streptomyces ferrugineus]